MDKIQRNYRLLIGIPDPSGKVILEVIEIDPPFTVEFDVKRSTLSTTNTATIRIYNLNETNRKKIRKDNFRYDIYKPITLQAGYGTSMPVIFKGNIRQADSVREGVNFITTIESFDGGDAIVNGQVNETFQAGTPNAQIMATVLSTLPNVGIGAIGSFPGVIPRGNSITGNSAQIADALSGGGFFIDLEKAYCLGDSECIRGSLDVITSDTGLLGTPVRQETILNFNMIFEPRLLLGQKILLDSSTGNNFNGEYKVISIQHKGTISEAVCGDAITSVGLWYGPQTLKNVN